MMQRRTFLGGLLAAVAASAAIGKGQVTVQSLAAAEEKIREVFPEPVEGYSLIIKPGYNLPVMRATPQVSIDLEHYAPLLIQGISWTPPGYHSMKANIEVKDEHADTLRAWFTRMLEDVRNPDLPLGHPKKDDYGGLVLFGPEGKDPLVTLEGAWPTSIDYDIATDPETGKMTVTAKAELQFDWVHQKVL